MTTQELLFLASEKTTDIESLFGGLTCPHVRLYPTLNEFEIVYDWTSNIGELPDGAKCYDLRFSASNSIVRIHFRFKVSDNSVE